MTIRTWIAYNWKTRRLEESVDVDIVCCEGWVILMMDLIVVNGEHSPQSIQLEMSCTGR